MFLMLETPSDSSRISGLVHILLKAGAAKSLVEDYATCLEYRFDETQALEEQKDDIGLLILQVLVLFQL